MKTFASIDEYIKSFPIEIQEKLLQIRKIIHRVAPDATEAIRYGMPTFRLNNKNLVHFAAFKNHIGFYPTPSGVASFEKELTPFVHAKGSIQFQLTKPLPLDLFIRIVKFRVKETNIK